jgi:hypothetical protein
LSSFTLSSSVESQIKNLDELIAQTVQSVSAQNRLSTEIPPTTQQSFDTISLRSQPRCPPTHQIYTCQPLYVPVINESLMLGLSSDSILTSVPSELEGTEVDKSLLNKVLIQYHTVQNNKLK